MINTVTTISMKIRLVICNKVNDAGVLPANNQNTKLLFVKKYVPEILDSHILKYKWMPNKVHIT